jgi:hypothetical protein
VLAVATAAPAAEAFPAVQSPDGGVVLHEHFIDVHPLSGSIPPDVVGLARVDAQDQLQSGFGRNGFAVERATRFARENAQVAIDDAGRILVALTPPASQGARIRRYFADGSPDWSLGGDGEIEVGVLGAYFDATDLLALPGGAVLLGGGVTPNGAQQRTLALAKIGPGGVLDAAFGGGDGIATADDGAGPSVASRIRITGKGILAGGDGLAARFTHAGALDPSFGGDGMIRGSRPGVVDAMGDGAVIAARAPVPEDGILVERWKEDGNVDDAWGEGGQATLKLSAKDFDKDGDGNLSGDRITYSVAEVVGLEDGRMLLGTTEHREPYDFSMVDCGDSHAVPVLLTAAGDLDSAGSGPPDGIEHLWPLKNGEFLVTGDIDRAFNCGYDPGYAHYARVVRYDADLGFVSQTDVRPILEPPSIEIASGPPPLSGSGADFRFEVTPGPRDNGDVTVECALDAAHWAACPVELHLHELDPGPHSLRARALGINGAPSDERTWSWSVAAPPPPPPAGDSSVSILAFAAGDALEIARAVRRLGARRLARRRRFPVTADAMLAGVWRARLTVRVPGAGAARAITLARSHASFAGPGDRRVAVGVTRRGRRLLRRSRRALQLHATVSFSAIGHRRLSASRTVAVTPAGSSRRR